MEKLFMDTYSFSAKRMEKICINHFAGLKTVSIETGPITVLIGPQATGKSVTAKLIYFFREIAPQILNAAIEGKSASDFKKEIQNKFCLYFPPDSWPHKNFSVVYENNAQKICVEYIHNEEKPPETSIELTLSAFYEESIAKFGKRFGELSKTVPEGDAPQNAVVRQQFRNEVFKALDQTLGKWSKFQQIFIPAGRAFFSLLKSSIFRTLESGQELDPFLVSFGAFLEESKDVLFERRLSKDKDNSEGMRAFQKTLSSVMSGTFKRVKREDSLHYSDSRKVRLPQASSGQQEALPLLVILGRFITLSHVSGRSVYIEEPEAHLFPETQRTIVEFMANTFRARQDQMCLVVTTHSPYILTAMNNLLEAGKQFQSNPKAAEKLEKIIPRSTALYPGEVKAYSIENGVAKSILCKESNLIDAEIIDRVSSEIAVKFDELLENV
jgi:AAA15 family ATPase/GTPase